MFAFVLKHKDPYHRQYFHHHNLQVQLPHLPIIRIFCSKSSDQIFKSQHPKVSVLMDMVHVKAIQNLLVSCEKVLDGDDDVTVVNDLENKVYYISFIILINHLIINHHSNGTSQRQKNLARNPRHCNILMATGETISIWRCVNHILYLSSVKIIKRKHAFYIMLVFSSKSPSL